MWIRDRLRLGGNAHLPQLLIQLVHEFRHPGLDGPVVVGVQLLDGYKRQILNYVALLGWSPKGELAPNRVRPQRTRSSRRRYISCLLYPSRCV